MAYFCASADRQRRTDSRCVQYDLLPIQVFRALAGKPRVVLEFRIILGASHQCTDAPRPLRLLRVGI
jgi:hypothetical protein